MLRNVVVFFDRKLHGIDENLIKEFFKQLSVLVNHEYFNGSTGSERFVKVYEAIEGMGYTSEKMMLELMQPCEVMLQRCYWLGKQKPCKTLFRPVKSSEGYCCSFNYRGIDNELEMYRN